ncbi:MAG: SdpI family protein [Candidatus Bathyarchaeota archaeon]|nr:SdpI family protein [Candidatus Termiticorpusculum sp.]
MNFWIFMLIMALVIPLIMIGFGSYFVKKAPAKINVIFGYRTNMSMKNQDTWKFAHNYCGKLWQTIGLIMLPLSVSAMFFVAGKEAYDVSIFGCILVIIQLIFLAGPIIPTEKALRKNFNNNGNRKNINYSD